MLFSEKFGLDPAKFIPHNPRWAASDDLLSLIGADIEKKSPQLILETGCGVSTLFFGHCLKQLGSGTVIALEHLLEHVEINHKIVVSHGLESIVNIVHGPLREYTIQGESYDWYDISKIKDLPEIGLLFVDGPPGSVGKLARYPAIPLFKPCLTEKTTIWLDDADRSDEQMIAQKWLSEVPSLKSQYHSTKRGALSFSFGG